METRVEFGDFQTPLTLAREVCAVIERTRFEPRSILEPTCGVGSFLQAASDAFPRASRVLGFDRNAKYVAIARSALYAVPPEQNAEVLEADFFATDWKRVVDDLSQPILILGNPPWVTNSVLGAIASDNLPAKSNVDNLRGIEAITGRSNFDISEWMLRNHIQVLAGRIGMLAVLCKTAVARKVLAFAWSHSLPIESASIYRIDAKQHFGASVDACLLLVSTRSGCHARECADYPSLSAERPGGWFGLRDGVLIADLKAFERWKPLCSSQQNGWRSGLKHDCSKVFELDGKERELKNGLGERVDIESEVVFPLLKSSDLAARRAPRKRILVPQRSMSESPEGLQSTAPKAWAYLASHSQLLTGRASSIYRNRPRFSVFGVGPYSFSSWKVAISGLYKKLDFVRVGPVASKPVLFDDTCYFFPCDSEEEATALHRLVSSDVARESLSALIFWDAKRPITARLLSSLDLGELARTLGFCDATSLSIAERQRREFYVGTYQRLRRRESSPADGTP